MKIRDSFNSYSLIACILQILAILFTILAVFGPDLSNTIAAEDVFMPASLISLILSFIFAIIGAYKAFHTENSKRKRIIAIVLIVLVPVLLIGVIFSLIARFSIG